MSGDVELIRSQAEINIVAILTAFRADDPIVKDLLIEACQPERAAAITCTLLALVNTALELLNLGDLTPDQALERIGLNAAQHLAGGQ